MGLREDLRLGIPSADPDNQPIPQSLPDDQAQARDAAAGPPLSFRDQVKKAAFEGAVKTASSPLGFYTAPARFIQQVGKKETTGADVVGSKLGLRWNEHPGLGGKYSFGSSDAPSAKTKESNIGKDANAEFADDAAKGEADLSKQPYGGLNLVGRPNVIAAHEGQAVSKRQEGLFEGADAAAQAANQHTGEANIHAIKSQADNAERQAALYNHLVEQQNAQEMRRANVLDQHVANQEKMMNDIRSEKIDPNRIFEGPAGGFKKVAGVLGVALGGFAQGLRGGPNTALEIINKSIDDDVNAQRANLDTKKGLLDSEKSLFGQKMQQFGDERAAAIATKQDVLAAAMATADAAMSDAKTDQEKARIETVQAGLQKEHAKLETQLHPWVQQQVTGVDMRKVYADKFAEARAKGADEKAADQFATEYTSRLQGNPVHTGGAALSGGKGEKGLPPTIITQRSSVQTSIKLLDRMNQLEKDVESGKVSKAAASDEWDNLANTYADEKTKAIKGQGATAEEGEHQRSLIPPAPWEASGKGLKFGVKKLLGGMTRQQWAKQESGILQGKDKELLKLSHEKRGVGGGVGEEEQ